MHDEVAPIFLTYKRRVLSDEALLDAVQKGCPLAPIRVHRSLHTKALGTASKRSAQILLQTDVHMCVGFTWDDTRLFNVLP